MEIKPIITKADHRAALKEVEGLMSAGKGSRNGERLDVLETLIEAYERKWVKAALEQSKESKAEAARLLRIDKNRMNYLCRKHQL